LTNIQKNNGIIKLKNGEIRASVTFTKGNAILKNNGKAAIPETAEKLSGYQLRYIYLIDKTCKITVPILPFSKIDEMGAGMYKGKKITLKERQEKD
jgi:hypothetical protein